MEAVLFLSELLITFQEYQIRDVNRDKSLGHSELLQADRVGVGLHCLHLYKLFTALAGSCSHFTTGFMSLILSLIQSLRTQSMTSPIHL